jgi:hypothetical protein
VNPTSKPTEPATPRNADEVRAFLKRTQAGDRSTLPVLQTMLRDPECVRVFGGELAESVEGAFLRAMSKDDVGFQEAARRKLESLRAELLGQGNTPVERLLVERVVACRLQVQDAELRYAHGQDKLNIRQADYHQRRMDAVNRRYLAALKALALVRKLAVPALQINLARKQVNIAAPATVNTGGTG